MDGTYLYQFFPFVLLYTTDPLQQVELRLMKRFIASNETPSIEAFSLEIWNYSPPRTLGNRLGSLLSFVGLLSSLSLALIFSFETFVTHFQICSLHVDVPHIFSN